MTCICAPSLDLLRTEFDVAHPDRSTLSDGCCASPAHSAQNPTSDHETGNARDFTADRLHGMISEDWANQIRNDPRVKYIIRDRQIYNPSIAPFWRPYTGSNPHDKHGHVSINSWSRDDLRPWTIDPQGDLDIMDKDTKAYFDAHFNGVRQAQRRARETQLLQGKRILGLAVSDKEIQDDLDRIADELKDGED